MSPRALESASQYVRDQSLYDAQVPRMEAKSRNFPPKPVGRAWALGTRRSSQRWAANRCFQTAKISDLSRPGDTAGQSQGKL